jgi:UDP-glucuronate 4-epimerase
MEFVATLEAILGQTATKKFEPMPSGDVPNTCANTTALAALTGFAPDTPLADGLRGFVDWYRAYMASAPLP